MFKTKDPILLERRKEVRSLLKGNWKDFWKGDFWPWMQTLTTIIFLAAIIIVEVVNLFTIAVFVAWLLFQLFAMWKVYENNTSEV